MRMTFVCHGCGKTVTKAVNDDGAKHRYCSTECYTAYRRKHAKNKYKAYCGTHDAKTCRKARIRITKEIFLYPEFKPEFGAEYTAERYQYGKNVGYVIVVNGHRVNVRRNECEEV